MLNNHSQQAKKPDMSLFLVKKAIIRKQYIIIVNAVYL